MAISFSVDGESRVIEHLEAKKAASVLSFAELFDLRGVTLDLSVGELYPLAEQVRAAMVGHQTARVAVVTNSNFVRGLAHTYAALTAQDHSKFQIFSDLEEALLWTTGQS